MIKLTMLLCHIWGILHRLILGALSSALTGGVGINAEGVQSAANLLESSVNVPKIAVILTDGKQIILEACTNKLAQAMQQSGVEMFSVGEFL